MTQSNPILGAGLSGLDYRNADNAGKQALLNHHKGPAAPAYAEAGTLWLDDAATPWLLKFYDGGEWIPLYAISPATNVATPYSGTAPLRLTGHAADTGAVNAYAVAPQPPLLSYAVGQIVTLKALVANTGAATLSVSGLTPAPIKAQDGLPLQAGMIAAGFVHLLMHDGVNFVLLNPAQAGPSGLLSVAEIQPAGTAAPVAVMSAWTKRAMNTTSHNTIAGAAHAAGVVTLPAGTYSVQGELAMGTAHGSAAVYYSCRLRNVTAGVTLINGTPQSPYLTPSTNILVCAGVFTLSFAANVELQYFAATIGAPRLGFDFASGDSHAWAGLRIRKEA